MLGKLISMCRRLKLDPCPSLCTKINSRWIKDLNVIPETLKLLEEDIGEILQNMGIGKKFLNRTLITQEIRARTDK
jgi:hypothetical protein